MKKFLVILSLTVLFPGINLLAQTAFTITECIEYSLEHHASNSIYTNEIKIAKEQEKEALSGYLPQVNGSITLDDNLKRQVTVIPAGAFSPEETRLQFGNQYNTNASIQLDQTIFDKSALVGIKASGPNREIAKLKQAKNKEDLIYNTAIAYYQVIVYQEQEKILLENRKKYQELLAIVQFRYEKGVSKKIELDRLKVNLNNVQAQIDLLQTNKALALNTLKNAMGLPLSEEVSVTDTVDYTQYVAPPAQLNLDVSNRLDFQIQNQNISLQEFDLKRKQAAYLPTVSAYARYGGQTFGDEFGKSFGNWFDVASIGLRVNVPIYNGGRKTSQTNQTQLNLWNAQTNLQLSKNNLQLQLQNASTQVTRSYTSLMSNKDNLALAKEVYETTNLEYQKGVSTLTDFLNADFSWKEAESNYTTSLFNYITSALEFERAKGTLVSTYNQFKN